MTLPPYPRTPEQAIEYAASLTRESGESRYAIRLPDGANAYGIKFAAVTRAELPDYLASGCEELTPFRP